MAAYDEKSMCKSAAHLVAALFDKRAGVRWNHLSGDLKDSLAIMRDQLEAAGYLAPYVKPDGSYGLV